MANKKFTPTLKMTSAQYEREMTRLQKAVTRLNEIRAKQIIKARTDGERIVVIADAHNLSTNRIRAILKKAGV